MTMRKLTALLIGISLVVSLSISIRSMTFAPENAAVKAASR